MRKPTSIENRIRVRAYYMWLSHYQAGVANAVLPGNSLGYWLAAERTELALAERRSQAARKGAATKAAAKIRTQHARVKSDCAALAHFAETVLQ